jgi:MFS family permease
VTSLVLLPDGSWLIAAVGWGIAGLGMGLAYSMLALLVLETAPAGQEGASSAALQLMFTLGTAFGAGSGGAIVGLAETGQLALPTALALVNALMLAAGVLAAIVALRVPRSPSDHGAPAVTGPAITLEHP